MSEIPCDIMRDILKQLPVKSLLRFRCLSKAYCSLIDTRDFINLQLSTNTNSSLIIVHQKVDHDVKRYTIDLDSSEVECDNPLSKSSYIIRANYWDHLKTSCFIFGSCNGLILLRNPQQGMLLWNPSTKKQRKLPDFWGPGDETRSCNFFLRGFGYDPASDDYKAVMILRTINGGHETMVYSVKHNSARRVEDCPYEPDYHIDSGTLIGSCLHWIVPEPKLIVAFNLEYERYGVVPIPDGCKNVPQCHMKLGEVEGCLCVSVDGGYVGIWVMKESWTRILSVNERNSNSPSCVGYSEKRVEIEMIGAEYDENSVSVSCIRSLVPVHV
ncbi:F-box protein CPR1-like [Mercurialis annua]|uniref:F-box protein CPR1-like n=1 Tax=Mercurialis annua TaxID=3986 RepID=UPI00215DEC45|nr:F-box protein CPR1-like [Mercurialis annua]